MKESIVSSDKSVIEKYGDNSFVKMIWTAVSVMIPQAAIGQTALAESITRIQRERFETLLDELESGEKLLTPEIVESEEFIHSFVIVYRAAINTYQREKIRRFARILLTAVEKDELASDRFEEFIRILDDLSERELYLLTELQFMENELYDDTKIRRGLRKDRISEGGVMDFVQTITSRIWEDFIEIASNKLEIENYEVLMILGGIKNSGLYTTGGNYQRISGFLQDIGTVTPLFEEFVEWIKLEADTDEMLYHKHESSDSDAD